MLRQPHAVASPSVDAAQGSGQQGGHREPVQGAAAVAGRAAEPKQPLLPRAATEANNVPDALDLERQDALRVTCVEPPALAPP
eukprot:8657520-Lingulodinium_polyedra.AAC.1